MTLEGFYALLLPAEGIKFAVTIDNKIPIHHPCTTLQELADKTRALEAKGKSVYFGCASYAQPEYKDKDGKKRYRTKENAVDAKAFWWDIDCGEGKDYMDQATALITLAGFCATAKVPVPMQVSSGNGIHCYWPMTEPVDKEKWEKIARLLHSIAVQHGFKSDPSRSRDIASILRPIETHNRKSLTHPLPVRVLVECEPLDQDEFTRGLLRLVGSNNEGGVSIGSQTQGNIQAEPNINADLCGGSDRQYPPSSAEVVAKHCAQIAFFKATGCDNEKHWRAALNVVKFTTEGEALAHTWSTTYKGYDADECQSKMDKWVVGPASCDEFNNYNGMCDKCPSKGKVKTPLHLGYTLETMPVQVIEVQEGELKRDIEYPHGYGMDKNMLFASYEDKAGALQRAYFCDASFYLYARFRELDGTMSVGVNAKIRRRSDGTDEWKKFTMPTSVIGEKGRALRSELAKYEIVALPGRDKFLENYVQAYLDMLRKRTEEIASYRTFGNQADGSLLIGTTLLVPGAESKEVMIGTQNTSSYLNIFKTTATSSADSWIKYASEAYNHPDHEQFQFLTYVALGSVLVDMFGLDMGGMINLYGEKGTGKSTAGEVGLSIWGDPKEMTSKWGDGGTTMNALFSKVSAMHSFPVMIDELTGIEGKEASSLLYQLLSGKTKDVLTQTRNRVIPPTPWRLLAIGNSNSSLMDSLSTAKDDAGAELTRALEIHWRKDIKTIDKNDMTRIMYHMGKHNGSIGRVFGQMVVDNRGKYRDALLQIQASVDKECGFAKEQRFWSVMLAASIAGGLIATKAGLLPFNFTDVKNYAIGQAKRNMGVADDCVFTPLDSFHRMVTAYSPFTINTEREGDGRHDRMPVLINGEPVARVVREDGVMYLSISAIREWCKKKQIGFLAMREEVAAAKIMISEDYKFYLGKGTDRQTGQVRCWKMDWNKLQGL